MQFRMSVPATVELILEIDATTLEEAQEVFNEGEFQIVSEEIYDMDFDNGVLEDIEE